MWTSAAGAPAKSKTPPVTPVSAPLAHTHADGASRRRARPRRVSAVTKRRQRSLASRCHLHHRRGQLLSTSPTKRGSDLANGKAKLSRLLLRAEAGCSWLPLRASRALRADAAALQPGMARVRAPGVWRLLALVRPREAHEPPLAPGPGRSDAHPVSCPCACTVVYTVKSTEKLHYFEERGCILSSPDVKPGKPAQPQTIRHQRVNACI